MPEPRRRLILANGENYLSYVVKKRRGGPPEWPRTYTAARDLVKTEVTNALQKFAALPTRKRFDDEVVLCLRLHPDMTAKSYDPSGLFGVVRDLENVGSRNYQLPISYVAQTKRIKKQFEQEIQQITGRMVFVRSNDAGFQRLLRVLDRPERELHDVFCHEIQSIEKFDLLSPSEQLLGFPPGWREGRIELVLHLSQHMEEEQTHFMRELFRGHDVSRRKTRVAPYPDGPTFVSCYLTHAALDEIAGANPFARRTRSSLEVWKIYAVHLSFPHHHHPSQARAQLSGSVYSMVALTRYIRCYEVRLSKMMPFQSKLPQALISLLMGLLSLAQYSTAH